MCPTKKTNHSEPFNPNPSANPQPCNPNANRGPTRVEVFVRGQEKKNGQTKKKNGENVDYVIIRYAWYVFSFGISILNVVDYLAPHIVSTSKMHVAGGGGGGMLFSRGRARFLALSAAGQATGRRVHYDACPIPTKLRGACSALSSWSMAYFIRSFVSRKLTGRPQGR